MIFLKNKSDNVIARLKTLQGPPTAFRMKSKCFTVLKFPLLPQVLPQVFPSLDLFNNTVCLSFLSQTSGTSTLLCLITVIFSPDLHIVEIFSLSPLQSIHWPPYEMLPILLSDFSI